LGKTALYCTFWRWKKTGKALNAEFAEAQRKDLRKSREEKTARAPGRPEGGFTIFLLSRLFAHTYERERL
jgi:hypothetical protein